MQMKLSLAHQGMVRRISEAAGMVRMDQHGNFKDDEGNLLVGNPVDWLRLVSWGLLVGNDGVFGLTPAGIKAAAGYDVELGG